MKLLKMAAVLALGLSTFAGAAFADRHGGGGGGGPHMSAGGGGGPHISAPRSFSPGPSVRFNKAPSFGNPVFNKSPKHFDGGPKWSGGGKWSGGERHHHHHRGGRFFYTAPLYDYYYDDSYYYADNSCGYYWRRWLRTGNPVWKARYYDCIE